MDGRTELIKFRLLMAFVVAFLGSAWYSVDEFMLTAFGTDATATVTKVTRGTKRGRFGASRGDEYLTTVTWAEPNGTFRRDDFTTGHPVGVEGRLIRVRYTPGEDGRARPAGYRNWAPPITLAVCSLAILGLGVWLYRESEEAYRPRRKKGERPA